MECGGLRSTREPAHNVDRLGVRDVGRIAEFIDRVRIRKPAQADELADPLSPVQLQLGPPVGEEEAPKLAVTEQIIELGLCSISQNRTKCSSKRATNTTAQ
jgi:hypothetical protein